MIILKLDGGLGNQMFQYAMARNLSLTKKIPFKLDLTFFGSYDPKLVTPRSYSLSPFDVVAEIATEEEIAKFMSKNRFIYKAKLKLSRYPGLRFLTHLYFEPSYLYDPNINKIKDNFYFYGFWQSEKYFSSHEAQIRQDFTLKKPLSLEAQQWANKIKNCNAISLHIRRGDYVSNPQTKAYHGLCSLSYYQKAIKIIKQKVKAPQFFIFSDDINWAKVNLKIDAPTFFISDPKTIKDYEEMILMSLCHHHIIANSSFSWWGAWLSLQEDKIIISPKKWFAHNDHHAQDLIPGGWLRL